LPPVIDEVLPEAIVPEARLDIKKLFIERVAEGLVKFYNGVSLKT
jgi:hypothetical protein